MFQEIFVTAPTLFPRCFTVPLKEELLDLMQQAGWVGPTKPREYWIEEKNNE